MVFLLNTFNRIVRIIYFDNIIDTNMEQIHAIIVSVSFYV